MNDSTDLLSIVIPVYNEGESLGAMVRILEAVLEMPHEIIVSYDFPEDNSVPVVEALQKKYDNIRLVLNDIGKGAANAVKKGVEVSRGPIVLIALADEIFPVFAVQSMLDKIREGYDLVSCTRYAYGGRRYGGSFIGGIMSRVANFLFRHITSMPLSDGTTGVKMMHKQVFEEIELESNPIGWSFAFELAIKAHIKGYKLAEIPVISVDRALGGVSTFKVVPWMMEYLRWFWWGIRKVNRFKR